MEEVLAIFRNLDYENQAFYESIVHLQTNQASTSLGCISMRQPQPKEPWVNLPNKFVGTHSKF
jgi:hypothetical protein